MTNESSSSASARAFAFRCACCGELHRGSPSFAFAKPPSYFDVPEAERDARIRLTSDLCVIDEAIFYIRALLEIPIREAREPFAWGVWVTQSAQSYHRYVETFERDQTGLGSFGWLGVVMPTYARRKAGEGIEFLQCRLAWGPPGRRPLVHLRESDHPLFVDQRDGIAWARAVEIAEATLHPRR